MVIVIILILVAFIVSIAVQFIINSRISAKPERPEADYDAGGSDRLIHYYYLDKIGEELPEGVTLNENFVANELEGTFTYIEGRYDCADFRMNSLVRLYLGYGDLLSDTLKASIKEVMLGFKYWMDQGGEDSMCYWSENHQILFAVSEYLVGQAFPEEIFSVDGKTGVEHMAMAKTRINHWMEQRFKYGFTEWYSNNYYPEDLGPMANFIEFAGDGEMVNRMKMIMDLAWYDLASQSYKYVGEDEGVPRTFYVFLSSSGRMYSDNRVSDDVGNRLRKFTDYVLQPEETALFTDSWKQSGNGFFNCFRQMYEATDNLGNPYYQVPEVIKAIFDDPAKEKIILSSQSLDVSKLEREGLLGQDVGQIMMQLNMEAFTNPEVIDNTIEYIAKNKMFSNSFLNDFKLVNLWFLRAFKLLGSVSRTFKPATNGVAIQRADVYTYKTDYFSMHNAQAYHPGEFADQQAINSVNFTDYLSLFTTQPAKIPRRSGTPTYWTGYGRLPMSVQTKNVTLQIYMPPEKAGFMEPMIVFATTHVFFPVGLYDEVDETHLDEGYVFARVGDAYVMVRSRHPMAFVPFSESNDETDRDNMLVRGSANDVLKEKYDLVQSGSGYHYFIIEVSSVENESFPEFKNRMLDNQIDFQEETGILEYTTIPYLDSGEKTMKLEYPGAFFVDGEIIDLDYSRHVADYLESGETPRKADIIHFVFDGHELELDYANNLRTTGD